VQDHHGDKAMEKLTRDELRDIYRSLTGLRDKNDDCSGHYWDDVDAVMAACHDELADKAIGLMRDQDWEWDGTGGDKELHTAYREIRAAIAAARKEKAK